MFKPIANHVEVAINRLPSQHRKPKIEAFVRSIVEPLQDLETAFLQLLTERAINTAVGVQMDVIGRIVGQTRNGLDDDTYRFRLKTRVLINRSEGTREQLIQIMVFALLPSVGRIEIRNEYPAAISVALFDLPIDSVLDKELFSFLRQGTAAGVRVTFSSSADDESEMLRFSDFLTLGEVVGIGSATLPSISSRKDAFPISGSIVLDAGTAVEETLNYDSITPTHFVLKVANITAFAHTDQYSIAFDNFVGKGLGDDGDSLIGGKLATVTA